MNESPIPMLLVSLFASAAGGAFIALGETSAPTLIGGGLLAVGGLLAQVCIIAVGVEWGLQRHASKG